MKLQLLVVCCILQSIRGSVKKTVVLRRRSIDFYFILLNVVLISRLAFSTAPFNPSDATLYVVGGDEAYKDQAPFQCSLQSYGEHFCGCAVINSKFVVTASHCINTSTADEINVMVGTNDLKCGGRFYEVERLIPHELFDTPKRANDIALVKVMGTIEFGENVKPIELEENEVPDGTEVGVTGWGRLQVSQQFFLVLLR